MATIPINLDDEIIRKLDNLIAKGIYKNRTEAIRDQIKIGLQKLQLVTFPERSSQHELALKKLLQMGKYPDLLKTKKSAVDLVAEGRER